MGVCDASAEGIRGRPCAGARPRSGWPRRWAALAVLAFLACDDVGGATDKSIDAAGAPADAAVGGGDASLSVPETRAEGLWALRAPIEVRESQWTLLELTAAGEGRAHGRFVERAPGDFADCECAIDGGLEVRREGGAVVVAGVIATPDPQEGDEPTGCDDVRFGLAQVQLRLEGRRGAGTVQTHIDPTEHVTCADARRHHERLVNGCSYVPSESWCFVQDVEARAVRERESTCDPVGDWLIPGQAFDLLARGDAVDLVQVSTDAAGEIRVRDRNGMDTEDCDPDPVCVWTGAPACVLRADVPQWFGGGRTPPPRVYAHACDTLVWRTVELHLAPPEPWARVRAADAMCDRAAWPVDLEAPPPEGARRAYRMEPL